MEEPALLIVLRNDDVGKHWQKGRNGNLIESMLLFLVMQLPLSETQQILVIHQQICYHKGMKSK